MFDVNKMGLQGKEVGKCHNPDFAQILSHKACVLWSPHMGNCFSFFQIHLDIAFCKQIP